MSRRKNNNEPNTRQLLLFCYLLGGMLFVAVVPTSFKASAGILPGVSTWEEFGLPACGNQYENAPCYSGNWSWWCAASPKPWEYNHHGVWNDDNSDCEPESRGFELVISKPPLRCPPGFTSATSSVFCEFDGTPSPDKGSGTPETCAGNPINLGMRSKYQREIDIAAVGKGFPAFARHYNSDIRRAYSGMLPRSAHDDHWRHTFERFILVKEAMDDASAVVHRQDGKALYFTNSGNGWIGDPDIFDELEEITDAQGTRIGWKYKLANRSVEQYDAGGKLVSIENPNGERITLTYVDDRLSQAANGKDYSMMFNYSASGQLESVQDSGETAVNYSYDTVSDGSPRLISANYASGASRLYHYESDRVPTTRQGDAPEHELTGITDERGVRFATWKYDSIGRPISSEHAGGADKTTLAYKSGGSVVVTNALSKETTYQFQVIQGIPRVTSVEGHPTTFCEGSNKFYSYTAEGWLAEKVDRKDVKTIYEYDSEGREISRTEAIGSTEERTITTEWHPTLNLPVNVTEPGKETIYSYDNQGQLLSRSVNELPTN